MRGSGLSIERFTKGKAQRRKSDAKSKKKVLIHKAQRRRQYEKVKKFQAKTTSRDDEDKARSGLSFYDRFFSELTRTNVDDETHEVDTRRDKRQEEEENEEAQHMKQHVVKPDPFYKAKKKAAMTKLEQQRAREEKQRQIAAMEKKVTQRKKRHVKLSQRTVTGQPVMKHHINDILARLEAEKKMSDNK